MEIVLPFPVIIARNNIWCKWTNKREFKTSQLRAKQSGKLTEQYSIKL